ncbi:MAG: NAD-dependent epimerase/dehydratase family protein [Anaerolineae bacterium]
MREVVTGGAGFLGAALANRLAADGHDVHVVDDLSTGDSTALDHRVTFHEGDVRDVHLLWKLLTDVDIVYHLAARVSVPESVLYPVDYNAVNTGGTVSLMTAARDVGVRRVVLASSGAVYGDQRRQPISETAAPRPTSPYAVSKLAAEWYVRAIGDLYRIETVVLRVFNAYGPGQRVPDAHPPVIPAFARKITTGASVVLHGDPPGGQTRDFVYVDDVVGAMRRAGETGGLSGATLNIGSGVETRVDTVVDVLEDVTGREARRLPSPEQSGGVSRMCADIRAARDALDWAPRVPLRDGLARLAEHIAPR